MKVNTKDIAASVIFILLAVVGLWLNLDHNLGTARRMGPGYMPALVFWIQLGLGGLILLAAFFNGPDPLEKWTGLESLTLALAIVLGTVVWLLAPYLGSFFGNTYNAIGLGMLAGFLVMCWAPGWRLLGYINAAMCVFSLLLEQGGLMLALIGTIWVSCLAEPEHRDRPLGVAGITIFLLALCWWVFIKQLDIRVAVWPQF